jgi:hypothetical protein
MEGAMSKEQINIAIAEACGWKYVGNETHAPDGSFRWSKEPEFPDYCNDLNAMHEAEKVLTDVQSTFYWKTLSELVNNTVGHDFDNQFECIHATAAQRAEAFLKTINKWEGGSDDN